MSDTRKVVINACFGGFGLSDEAERRLIGCEHVKLVEPVEYYGGVEGWQARFAKEQAKDLFGINVHDGKVVVDRHDADDARDCPALVKLVEEMGDAANGDCARLRVVEIPADVQWEIDEYDGRESIDEAHRSWS